MDQEKELFPPEFKSDHRPEQNSKKAKTQKVSGLWFSLSLCVTQTQTLWFLATFVCMAQGMAMSVDPPFGSRLKYLNNFWMDCDGILYRQSWSPED